MTAIGTPELTVTVPCATCGGTGGKYQHYSADRTSQYVPCPTCNGTGVTRTPVTCAGCRWYAGDDDGICVVRNVENLIEMESMFGCLLWEPKEATDGNG